MKKILTVFLLILVMFPSVALADEHGFELGLSVGPSYIVDEGWASSAHIHAVWLIPHTIVGLGIGYERLSDDHGHNTFSIVSQFHIWNGLTLALAPGITFDDDASASIHIEALYEFELNEHLHIGPAFEMALDKHSVHITPGIHIGFGFK